MTSFTGPITHFKETSGSRRWFGNLPVGIDPDYVVLSDDFLTIFDTTNIWEVVKDAGASVALAADNLNGAITISSTATTDNDGGLFQTLEENFKLSSGKRLWAETKMQISDATQTDMFFGLSTVVATNPENILTTGDRVGFQKDDGSTSILAKTEKDTVETSTDTGKTMSNATDVKLGIYWDGISRVEFYVDRTLVATHTTNIVDDENLSVCGFHLSGDTTGTKTSTWDYVTVVAER